MKMAAVAAAAIATSRLQSVLVDDDLYINQRLGVAFRKPANWGYASIKQFKIIRDEYSIAVHSEVLNEEMRDWDLPILTITQCPLNERIGPSIVVYVEKNELEEGESLFSVMPLLQDYHASMFKGYSRVGNYRAGQVSGCESVEYVSKFIYERRSGESFWVRNRSLCSVRGMLMYTMHMMDMPEQGINAQEEFDRFEQSIMYV